MKKKCKRIWRRIKTLWKWYDLGYYHCDKCPYCWSEWSYEGDGDCGCYIHGDLWDTCRLIEPFRSIIGWPKKRYAEYWESHQYDDFDQVWDTMIREETAFEEALMILLKDRTVCWTDADGKLNPIPNDFIVNDFRAESFNQALLHYEQKAHPHVNKPPVRKRWANLIRETWKECVYDKVAPYLPRRRKR